MYLKSKLNVWGTLLTFLSLFIVIHVFNLNIGQEANSNQYLDAAKLTNYTLLESLILGHKNTTSFSGSPEMNSHYLDFTPKSENRINFSLQSLTDLAASISLSSTTYSVIIRYHDKDLLMSQLNAVLRQSYKPSAIYIMAPEMEKSNIEAMVVQDDILHVKSSPESNNYYWFDNKIESDFVFVLDNPSVQPGTQYMEFILRLLNTPHFKHTFISTENNQPCSFKNAHYVNKLNDIWAFRKEWFLDLLANQQQLHPSLALYQSLQIPSVRIPTLKNYPQLLGNTNIETCKEEQDAAAAATVLFYITDMSAPINDLLCHFNENHKVVHLVTTFAMDTSPCPTHENAIIRHTITRAKNEFNHLVNVLSPRVVIYEKTDASTTFTNDRFTSTIKQIQKVTYIGLPKIDIAYTSWISDLSINSLEQWNTPRVKLIVTTSGKNRLDNIKRIVKSLENANYLGDKVDLYMLMDEKSDPSTSKFIHNIAWSAGNKQIRHRISGVHPMQIFAESWYPSDDHEYAVMLDDRMELSPLFYIWIKQTLLTTRYSTTATSNKQLFGVSLYSPRVIDTDPSGRQLLQQRHDGSPYFMQAPSGAGALYFPEHWREFHDYITARITDQAIVKKKTKQRHLFRDSFLKASRSDSWVNSWRKYFDEVINMRGYVMLYPAYHQSYSTLHIDLPKKKKDLYETVEKLYHIPLSHTVSPQLPDMDSLLVLDFYGNPVDQPSELMERGHELHRTFSACEPKLDHHHDPSDMLCPFSHLIQIPVEQAPQDVPVLSVDLYSA